MADSQKVENSNSGFSKDENKDFRRAIPYDPAVLKRRKLWNKDDLSSGDLFGRMGAKNGRDTQSNVLQSHQGDRKENPPNAKHKAGDTRRYNSPSEARSHGARGNNGAGVHKTGPSIQ